MTKEDIYAIFDIETNGLLHELTQLHCLSYALYHKGKIIKEESLTDLTLIQDFFTKPYIFVGHNIIRYDLPALHLLSLTVPDNLQLIDTLGLSWYLHPYRKQHGLESHGEELGIPKPVIKDWESLSLQDYIHRCETDVRINTELFRRQMSYLSAIYNDSMPDITKLIKYSNFKLDCLRVQEREGITLNTELCNKHLNDLIPIYDSKIQTLSNLMPVELGKIIKTRPKVLQKQNGELSSHGIKWFEYLLSNNLPLESEVIREQPNPGSDTQLKEWLFTLGWKPITFKDSKQTGKKIPQVSLPFGQGICQSVKDLFPDNPGLEELESLFKIKHRIGVFQSYLDNQRDGKVYATANGYTNTLRLTHSKPVVNLPKPGVYYGSEIREVLTVPNDNYIMVGSDLSGLEDNAKQHYIYFYDPNYVTEMRVPGFDPHLDIGLLAGLVNQDDITFFNTYNPDTATDEEKNRYKSIKKIRGTAKSANFAATYGAGGPKISETAKISLEEGDSLHKTYWQRNWAVKKIADTAKTKTVGKQKWIFNPVSNLWMFLKAEKDRFSTLNQSTGVYIFDTWVRYVRNLLEPYGIYIILQYHDEILLICPKDKLFIVKDSLLLAMKQANEELKLNVEITNSTEVGNNYSECH